MACALFFGCADKKAAGTLYIKALEAYEKKDFSASGAFINQCLLCDKKNKRAKFLKAKIAFFQGRHDEAGKILSDLYKSNPDNKDIERYLIQSLIFCGQTRRADEAIQAALKNDRGDWRLYYLASVAAAKEKNAEKRLEMLSEAQNALQDAARVFFDEAFVWQSLGVSGKAKEYMEKCLFLDKNYKKFFVGFTEENDGQID